MTRLFRGTPCSTPASLPDCLGGVVELPVWRMGFHANSFRWEHARDQARAVSGSSFHILRPHCCLDFITLNQSNTQRLKYLDLPNIFEEQKKQ